jgi:hypothetical protein
MFRKEPWKFLRKVEKARDEVFLLIPALRYELKKQTIYQ